MYTQVLQFYAHQMGLLDERQADSWADTFAEDAVFQEAARMDPLLGRPAIRASARASVERAAASGLQVRHWIGMLQVRPGPNGTVDTRCYALAMRTPKGGELELFASVVCADHLVPTRGGWMVRHRDLTHDGFAPA
ncbi:nuclear transport factor 2 family protein [Frankia casuarinae]|uniref:nuclear transport factor 2 family protein n=1 Tax=Frankia casuarinae (strain DSM 45818 / CECT 9043 / HFP020203 / CcI3) TaxID=106370 RepID=UPI000557B2D1|nr:nuclear transport factor 2 family protein [Frankia casuarinae]